MKKTRHHLQAWKLSRRLLRDIFLITETFPQAERYGLVAQLGKPAVSIPSDIAEGAAMNTAREFRHCPGIARGSLA